MAFWLAVTTASTSHASKAISSQATLHTPSTTRRVSGETFLINWERLGISLKTPVDVSTWVTVMTLYFLLFRAASISGSWGRPPTSGALSMSTFAP